jgi:carbamate kinase
MGPEVESAIRFVEERGEKAIITSIDRALDAIKGKAGTAIHQ